MMSWNSRSMAQLAATFMLNGSSNPAARSTPQAAMTSAKVVGGVTPLSARIGSL